MESIIKVENVSKKFGADTALNNVSIEFESGKIYGIVGRNGSGKTVLFKTIIGFLKPTSGKVIVDGKEIGKDTDFADNIGIIIETPGFLSSFQFLMSQQKTGRRYQTLIRLGATYETLCQSAGKQITWFMGLPVLVAAVSSLFGVRALFTGILSSRTRGTVSEMLLVSAAMILLLCVIEYIYMRVVKRSSDRYLLTLMQPQREE